MSDDNRSSESAFSIFWKQYGTMLTLVGLLLLLLWSYWNSLTRLAHFWENPKYSHGYLIPLFTIVMLWLRRDQARVANNMRGSVGGSFLHLLTHGDYAGLVSGYMLPIGCFLAGIGGVIAFTAQESFFPNGGDSLPLFQFIGLAIGLVGSGLLIGGLPEGEVDVSARIAGLMIVSLGVVIRLASTYWPNISPELTSFLPCVIGLFLLVGGWKTMRWAATPLAFLIFMFPLPAVLEGGLLTPLQHFSTVCSRYALQTIGIACFNEGNQIFMGETSIGIVEACSGLRMLTMFMALATALNMVTERPWWERIVIFLSSVPIALFSNITRITVTGILYMVAADKNNALGITKEFAETVFHDLGGWLMMPLALGLLYVEYQILTHLVIEEMPVGGMPLGLNIRRTPRKPALDL